MVTSLVNVIFPSNNLVTILPDIISKSYRALLKSKAAVRPASINTPIVPEVGELALLEPLKFKPVPSFSKLEDKVIIRVELLALSTPGNLSLIYILPR